MKEFAKRNMWSLIGVVLLVAVVLTACGQAAATEAPTPEVTAGPTQEATEAPTEAVSGETGPLIMLDWSGYELPEFWTEFADKYPDVQVEFSFLTESADVYPKLQTGDYVADLIHPCNQYWKLLVDEGMVQPIDTTKLSHWSGMMESLTKEGEFNGQQYWVPWDWGFESILVRQDLVESVPESWADLWDPQYKGHVAVYDSGETMHVITALALGLDPWNTTPEEDAQIKQKMMELAPNVLTYWSDQTELDQLVASGDVWVAASAWNASFISLRDQGYDVVYLDPTEGRTGYLCGFAIPTTAKYVDLALAMIDAYIAPESQAKLGNDYGYGVANADAIPLIDPATAELLGLNNPGTIDRLVFYQGITPEKREFWINEWADVKASQ